MQETSVEKVKNLLEHHKGEENAITAKSIAFICNLPDSNGNPNVRAIIRFIIEEYSLPIAASPKGFFLISNDEEYAKYMNNLNDRITGIEKRKTALVKSYNTYFGADSA